MLSARFRTVFQILGLGVLILGAVWYGVFYEKYATFAAWKDPDLGEIRVMGRSLDRFEGWGVRMFWRKGVGPWATYHLEHQGGYWSDVQVRKMNRTVVVLREGAVVGRLDSSTGAFQQVQKGISHALPMSVLFGEEPGFSPRREVYPETPGWAAVWPAQFLPPPETSRSER